MRNGTRGSRSLGQTEQPGFPYRVSAIITSGGKQLGGVKVQLMDPKSSAVLEEKATDQLGQVYFDRVNSDQVKVKPAPEAGLISIPADVLVIPTPISRWWWNAWDWEGDSVRFQIGKDAAGAAAAEKAKKDDETFQNVLLWGGAIVGVYLIYRWAKKAE